MQRSLERRSINDINEHNTKQNDNILRRNLIDKKMMARITNEQKQHLQSRLFKRARGLLTTVEEDDDVEYAMIKARSLKGDDDKSGAKPANPPPAKAPTKEGDSNRPSSTTAEHKSSETKPAHPTPADGAPKKEDAKKNDKSDEDSNRSGGNTAENKSSPESKPVHPSPADDKDKSGNDNVKIQAVSPTGPKGSDSTDKSSSPTSSESSSSSSHSYSSKGKSSKSSKGGTCDKRLTTAYEQMRVLPEVFGEITSPSDVTKTCSFYPTAGFNFGCPFIYFPPFFGFLDSEEMYQSAVDDVAIGTAFWSLVLYCQCYQAFDLNCAAKVPHGPPSAVASYDIGDKFVNSYSEFIPSSTPEKRLEYCQMAGVWNGDFDRSVAYDFSPEVRDCGCYFVGTAKDMVGTCPGVDLGAYFPIEFTEGGGGEESHLDTEVLMKENATYYPTMSPSDE